jgi:tetratricopeptide (TPR) repeat protein
MSDHGKAFDIKGFAEGFGEAFDPKGCVAAFREAFDLGDAARSFASSFRDGANLLSRHLRWVRAALHVGRRHATGIHGQLLLQRLLADVAGGGGSAIRALAEIRKLLGSYNPRIDAIPDEHLPTLVKRILDDLEKPAARAEDFAGTVGRALTEAQAKAAELAFAEAAQVLDVALAQTVAEDQERARGRAALLAERGRVARLQLRYREAGGFYQQAAETVAFDAPSAWDHLLNAASAYSEQGDEFGDNRALEDAIAIYRSALAPVPDRQVPFDWVAIQINLGMALATLGEREKGTTHLQEAIATFRMALQEQAGHRRPLNWAATQNNLGNALAVLGAREGSPALLEEAVAAFREALKEWTQERAPLDWAKVHNNLGNALSKLGEWENTIERLEEAVAVYRAALTERARERVPLEWATTQSNLGEALRVLGERESSTARLEEALAAFRAALAEYTRERMPLRWALVQNNLANALAALGEQKVGFARRALLQDSVAAYDAALDGLTECGAALQTEICRANRELAIRLLEAA